MTIIITTQCLTAYIERLRKFLEDHSDFKYRSDVALLFATFIGNLSFLKKERKRENFQPDIIFCNIAAEGGQLKALHWLRKNNCDWNENTCADAALGGHLEILQWLKNNG